MQKRVKLHFSLILLSFIFLFHTPGWADNDHFVVITHSSLEGKLVLNQLKLIYSMRKRSIGDIDLRIVSFKDNDERFIQFSIECLKLSPRVLQRLWQRNLFTGAGWVPVFVSTKQEMINYVRRNPGAIGYLKLSALKNEDINSINIVECKL